VNLATSIKSIFWRPPRAKPLPHIVEGMYEGLYSGKGATSDLPDLLRDMDRRLRELEGNQPR
jgi:hypothetical protein